MFLLQYVSVIKKVPEHLHGTGRFMGFMAAGLRFYLLGSQAVRGQVARK